VIDDCSVFKFLQRSVEEEHLIGFQTENFVFELI